MRLEKALDAYYEKFGKNYPLVITNTLTDEENVREIQKCIESGKPATEPEYEDEVY